MELAVMVLLIKGEMQRYLGWEWALLSKRRRQSIQTLVNNTRGSIVPLA